MLLLTNWVTEIEMMGHKDKSIMYPLYVLQRHMLMSNSGKIKPVTLAVVDLHLSEGISSLFPLIVSGIKWI